MNITMKRNMILLIEMIVLLLAVLTQPDREFSRQ